MLNLSKIQLELERAKEKLRSVEETIQKVEGKTFLNGPVRYSGLKVELHSDRTKNPVTVEDLKNQRRVTVPADDSRIQRLSSGDAIFSLKRNLREKESGIIHKRQNSDRPQGIFARLSGLPYKQVEDEDEDDFVKKPTLPSKVFITASEMPSRQEVIAAQSVDEQSKQRNRRMFGALVGTLQKFRKEETRVREREEKRLKVEKKLEEDAEREKEKLMKEKRELFLEKKRREVEIKRIEWSLNRVKEYEAWEANVLPLKNFIQTQAKPHIFYLPSVHNNKTEERLAHSQKLVERMIEKRKTNLKEEIENSERKARKTAGEEVEEEEAENIPENNEETHNSEQQMQDEFQTDNKENGYFEERKDQTKITKDFEETKETDEKIEENLDEVQGSQTNESNECLDSKQNERGNNKNESKEESPVPDCKVFKNELNSIKEEKSDGAEEASEDHLGKKDKTFSKNDDEKTNEVENADFCIHEPTEAVINSVVQVGESEKFEKSLEEGEKQEEEKSDSSLLKSNDSKILEKNSELEISYKKETISEGEPKTKNNWKRKSESYERKNKTDEMSRRNDKSRSTKTNRRYRSPKKGSKSPKNSPRDNRRRSNSRRRRYFRKRSRSSSRPRKSRKSRSPISMRRRKNILPSKEKSPNIQSRKRSSRSSSSASSKKRRSRSSSSGFSKTD